jgi:protein SCO1/2
MKAFNQLSLFILLFFCGSVILFGQESKIKGIKNANEPEIGVVEHLNGYIPAGIKLYGVKNDTNDLKSLINKPTILNLVYYRCPGICSPVMNSLAEVITKMDMVPGKDYQVLTISFDHREGFDLAAKKRKTYFTRFNNPIDSMGWRFYISDSLDIAKLCQTVGFNFKRTGNDYLHPGVIFILSPEGKITRYHNGTNYLPFEVKLSLIEASKGLAMPTISRVLSFCYSYDPEGQRYVLNVTKVSGTLILFFGLVLLLVLIMKPKHKNVTKSKEE